MHSMHVRLQFSCCCLLHLYREGGSRSRLAGTRTKQGKRESSTFILNGQQTDSWPADEDFGGLMPAVSQHLAERIAFHFWILIHSSQPPSVHNTAVHNVKDGSAIVLASYHQACNQQPPSHHALMFSCHNHQAALSGACGHCIQYSHTAA
jgi:hypothetical protein